MVLGRGLGDPQMQKYKTSICGECKYFKSKKASYRSVHGSCRHPKAPSKHERIVSPGPARNVSSNSIACHEFKVRPF